MKCHACGSVDDFHHDLIFTENNSTMNIYVCLKCGTIKVPLEEDEKKMKGRVTKEATFDCAHRLYKYEGACGKLHGHTYKVQASWSSDKHWDDFGMIRDFKECSDELNHVIAIFDHSVVLQKDDPFVSTLISWEQKVVTMDNQPTAENMAQYIKDALNCEEVKLWETPTSFVTV